MALALLVSFGSNTNPPDDKIKDIRVQLSEQLRCLDVRMESQVALVAELQDYFRRRAEVELDYSKNLDKLAKSLQLRHKEQKQKREQWPLFSSYSCWQQLVTQTKDLSKHHAALSEVYSTQLVSRLAQVMEDVQRIYRRCREIGYETHEEILRVLHELHTTMKTYHSYQGEYRNAETKLRVAENQRLKLEQSIPREKLDRSKKYRLIEKEVQKRKNKYNEAKLNALKARNEYMLCLEASNTTIHKYFVDDLSDLIDCMDFGFHNCVSRALLMHVSAEENSMRSAQLGLDQMSSSVNSLDSRLDKQKFLEFNHAAFMIPKKFEFQGQKDETLENELQKSLREELEARMSQLQNRITSLRTESEEVWKTLETAEITLLDMISTKDYECNGYFSDGTLSSTTSKPPETVSIKLRADRQETEDFYLSKFREYLLGTSRIARLESKMEYIRQTLLDASGDSPTSLKGLQQRSGQVTKPPRRKRIGRLQMNGQPKLFGGSLEEYLEATNQEIPLILKSCIRVINLYGLHHQGIFRVSGSQVEINNFRESFERGEDPLADVTDASDINSVAGVLKLYLRELREPLFPILYFEHFMELAQLESRHEFVLKMKDLVQSLPRSVVIVMRYLFAFLNHLSEFSDENMMDPYNLAICFGPTLVPVPEDKDQVQFQNQVNELIKNIILFHEDIFPMDGGLMYEKYISREPDETDVGDSPSDHTQEDLDSEVYPSEDESECLEATAQFDFIARSDRELSFKKGDSMILYSQVSNDWWKGSMNGQEGLVPDKYIMLKIKDEDREKLELLKSSSSEESMRRRASSSNDSILSSNASSSTHNSPVTNVASATWPDPELSRRSILSEPMPLISLPTQETRSTTSLPAPPPRRTASLGGTEVTSNNMIGAVEAALNNAQLLATAALQAESEDKQGDEEDKLSVFLDSLPADSTREIDSRPDTPISDDNDLHLEEPVKEKESNKKSHLKSQSISEVENSRRGSPPESVNFSQSRELWRRRAASQNQLETEKDTVKMFRSNHEFWELRQKHTPDLVMDLPVLGSSSPKEVSESSKSMSMSSLSSLSSSSSSGEEETSPPEPVASSAGLESPDMTTAAERFAKQNQCTLKKNTKVSHGVSMDAQTQTVKGTNKWGKHSSAEMSDKNDMCTDSISDHGNEEHMKHSLDSIKPVGSEPDIMPTRSPCSQRSVSKIVGKFDQGSSLPSQPITASSFKPQVKVKPQILKKPVLPVPHPHQTQPSPEALHKEKVQDTVNSS